MTTVEGSLRVPGDKSISHRALMLGALGDGPSRISNILESADVHSTAGVLRALGAKIPPLDKEVVVEGKGLRGLTQPSEQLDCGNSGTTSRLMSGIVAGSHVTATLIGDESLSRRPMRRVATPLEAMGAQITLPEHGGLPMTIHGGHLHSIEYRTEVASAQIKSAILLAGVVAGVSVTVDEPGKTRDHTERMLAGRGVRIQLSSDRTIALEPTTSLSAQDTDVPGDPSSAAFFAALAALADDGFVYLEHVCLNSTRIGFLGVLGRMCAQVSLHDRRDEGGEPVGSISVSPPANGLLATSVGAAEVPGMIDELPMLACVATRAQGETRITGASELRLKESDRISAVVSNLRRIGADAEELPDGMVIRGSDKPLAGRIVTHGDHRLAMAFGVLGAIGGNSIEVDDRACVAVSYPSFWRDLEHVLGHS